MAHVAHEQQAAARHGPSLTTKRGIVAVWRERARHRLPALLEGVGQIAANHAQPVGIGEELVLGIDRRDGVLKIDDRCQRGFEDDVGDACLVCPAYCVLAIDDHVDDEAVVFEHRAALVMTDKSGGIGELGVALTVPFAPRSLGKRDGFVEKFSPCRDYRRTAFLVVTAGSRGRRIERIGAVERVVEAAPARVGSVEQKARVEHRHHQLRSRHPRDFAIDVLRGNFECGRLGHEIADFAQEGFVFVLIYRRTATLLVPGVDARLQIIALFQQSAVTRRKFAEQVGKALPEALGIQLDRREHLGLDELRQPRIDIQSCTCRPVGHVSSQRLRRPRNATGN